MKRVALLIYIVLIFGGCWLDTDSDVVSKNLSTKSDMFQIDRRVIFYNSIVDKYILTIQGKCSITKDNRDNQLEVTCKTGYNEYKKHYLGLSDNVTYFVEQLNSENTSAYNYKVIFKPEAIIPDIDLSISQ